MTVVVLIAGMAIVIAALRLGGFMLAGFDVPPAWEESLTFAPVATLTALIVSAMLARPAELPTRLVAGIVAVAVAALSRRAWLAILAGFVVYLLLRGL
jgi:branched-subunit amino acid transport protein